MLFKDINQQANEIFESKRIQALSEKSKFDNFKSSVTNDAKKVGNFAKDLFDDGFDDIMKDGKKSSDEREKIKNAKASGRSRWDIEKNSFLYGVPGEKRDTKDKKNDKIIPDPKVAPEKEEDKKAKSTSHSITLTSKDQVRLEKNIFNQDIKTKRIIYKSLLNLYNELDNKGKIKTEAFDYLSMERKLLSDQELIKILDYINNARRRIKEKLKESIILEDTFKKLKSNIVSKEWKKRGSKRDKDNLVKLMRFFKLNDMQIFTAFNKIGKPLTYSELKRLNIDIKHAGMSVTKQDLEKLTHTLGKFKLKNFLIKLNNDIQNEY